MSSYADHQRMVTLEQRVATLELRAAEAERIAIELEKRVIDQLNMWQQQIQLLASQSQPLPPLDTSGGIVSDPPSPYEQWREKKAARKAAD